MMLPLQHQFVGDGHSQNSPSSQIITLVVPANAGTHNPRQQSLAKAGGLIAGVRRDDPWK
jgi:hypothetical protein